MKADKPFLIVFAVLALFYGAWLMTFWPGIMGEDSLAILLQIEGRPLDVMKPVIWYLFVKLLYEPHRHIEVAIILQLLLGALIFARMLAWTWREHLTRTFFFVLFFVALAPPVLYYQSALYADGVFSLAVAGLVFESWLIVRAKRASNWSLAWLAVLVPFALFFRPNGIFMLVILIPLVAAVPFADKLKISAIFLAWCGLALIANARHPAWNQHGSMFPLALYETVNFLQPNPTGIRPVREHITQSTLDVLESRMPAGDVLKFYDRNYWDPLVFRQAGPQYLKLSEEQKQVVVRDFLCCNLWDNLPAFFGSRVHIFLMSAFANGGFASPVETATFLPQTQSASRVHPFDMGWVGRFMNGAVTVSYGQRWWMWTPCLGIGLLAAIMARNWRRREWLLLLVMAPLALQLAGVFFFSIASEFRYLLFIFTATAALLPIYVATRSLGRPGPQPR